ATTIFSVTDGTCTASVTVHVIDDCCTHPSGNFGERVLITDAVNQPVGNVIPATASALANYYSSSTINTNDLLTFQGPFEVDQNIDFVNCPSMIFLAPLPAQPLSSINVPSGKQLSISDCELWGCAHL